MGIAHTVEKEESNSQEVWHDTKEPSNPTVGCSNQCIIHYHLSESLVQEALENMMVDRTCAAVAHRLSTNTEIRHHCCYQNWESCGTRFTQ